MIIRALELDNVKSYIHETITFTPGTNAICGPNGAGKSTILETIGYVLFNEPPCKPIANLVREGEKVATIVVTLVGRDEREYQVVRKCGGASQYYVYDPELGTKVTASTDDVLAWLREQFGVEETVDLAALFRDAVGVPQGLLTAAFLQSAASRKATFDPLLRVEEYRAASDKLLNTKRALDEMVTAAGRDEAGLTAEVRSLPDVEREVARLTTDVARAEERGAALAAELAQMAERRAALEAVQARLQELQQQSARAEERHARLTSARQQAGAALAQAEAAARVMAESAPGHRSYLAAAEQRRALEAREQARARAQRAVDEQRNAQKLAADRLARLRADLADAEKAAATAESLAPAVREQERLEQALAEVRALARQHESAQKRMGEEQRRAQQLAQRLEAVAAQLAERAPLEQELATGEQRVTALNESLVALRAQEAGDAALLDQLEKQSTTLAHVDGARCPVCEAELSAERRGELLAHNRAEIAERQRLLADARREIGRLAGQSQAAAQAQRELQARLGRLPHAEEHAALAAERERQDALVQAAGQEAQRLADAAAQVQPLSAQLAALGDPRGAYQGALAIGARRQEHAAQLATQETTARDIAARLTELEGELTAYARLDDDLAAARVQLAASEPAHQRYLQHEREAADLEARQARSREAEAELAEATQQLQALQAQLAEAEAGFDRAEYARITAAHLNASQEQSRVTAQLEMLSRDLDRGRQRLAQLQQANQRLQAVRQQLAQYQELGRTLETMRRILKDAGPQVTRALVEAISLQAARLYTDILGDVTTRLQWSEDYEILAHCNGYERTYQQLSGGEQMAAAIAVRLALLRDISEINLAFFDEPTSNLDETRRENLAGQIINVGGFAQLFVVSHDDSFEQATDNVVRLEKDSGASRVVA